MAILYSCVLWVLVVWEYRLLLASLGLNLTLADSLAALALARVALLSPVPGALALMEAAQVIGLRMVGRTASDGLGIGLLMRARDLVFVVAGLATLAALRRRTARR